MKESRLMIQSSTCNFQLQGMSKFALKALPRFLQVSEREFVPFHGDLTFGLQSLLNYYLELYFLEFLFISSVVPPRHYSRCLQQGNSQSTVLYISPSAKVYEFKVLERKKLHEQSNIFVVKDPIMKRMCFLIIFRVFLLLSSSLPFIFFYSISLRRQKTFLPFQLFSAFLPTFKCSSAYPTIQLKI